MKISIICPLYNGEKYIESLQTSLEMQQDVKVESINYVLTESNDGSEKILRTINANYTKIRKEQFSHSLTREKCAMKASGDIIVFISQDVVIRDKFWLYNLTRDITNGSCDAAFSRQVCKSNGIEKYIRHINYRNKSRIVSKSDINELGLMTFFFSDASSAISKNKFVEINGYDDKNLIINEDVYLAYKLIMNGYRIKYCADSEVEHSHKFTLKQLFNRYFDTGVFSAENSYLLKYNANKSGMKLVKSVFMNALKNKDFKAVISIIPNFASRFIGMQLGRRYEKLSKNLSVKFSLNKNYWI